RGGARPVGAGGGGGGGGRESGGAGGGGGEEGRGEAPAEGGVGCFLAGGAPQRRPRLAARRERELEVRGRLAAGAGGVDGTRLARDQVAAKGVLHIPRRIPPAPEAREGALVIPDPQARRGMQRRRLHAPPGDAALCAVRAA